MTSGRSSSDCYGLTTDASHHGADSAPRQGYRSVFGVSEFGLPRSLRRASMCQPGAQIDPLQITIGARHRHLPTPWCLIERPDLLARETGTRKFVTRVQVMLNSAAIARPLRVSEMYRDPRRVDDAGPKVVQFLDRVRDQKANPTSPLSRYIEGWAQADLEKILDASAPSYRFTDPFVGSFDGRSLHKYFNLLQNRLSCTGAISRRELAFFLRGPMKLRSHKELQFWREAPRIGLTGVAEIEIGEQGITAERVAYDLNLASDILRRALALH